MDVTDLPSRFKTAGCSSGIFVCQLLLQGFFSKINEGRNVPSEDGGKHS